MRRVLEYVCMCLHIFEREKAKREVVPLVCSLVKNISFDCKEVFLTLIYSISTRELLTRLSVKSWLSGEVK